MLIWLDESINMINFENNDDALNGLSAILKAVQKGHHYVLGKRNTFETIAKNASLSRTEREIASILLNNLTTLAPLKNIIKPKIIVTNNDNSTPIKNENDCWITPLSFLGQININSTELLAENLNDVHLFENAAIHYCIKSSINSNISIKKTSGGGATTPAILINSIDHKEFCLCITDSDKESPKSKSSSTSKNCKKIVKKKQNKNIVSHFTLQCREAENLIPISLFQEIVISKKQQQWVWHRDNLYSVDKMPHKYIDLKNGLKLERIYNLNNTSPTRVYWLSFFKKLSEQMIVENYCNDQDKCRLNNIGTCECIIGHGFGNSILCDANVYMNSHTDEEIYERIKNDFNINEWIEVGKIVFEWCCAPHKMRS